MDSKSISLQIVVIPIPTERACVMIPMSLSEALGIRAGRAKYYQKATGVGSPCPLDAWVRAVITLRNRSSLQLKQAAEALVRAHNLSFVDTDVVSASLTPFPMSLHRTSRFTVVGDLTLGLLTLVLTRIFTRNAVAIAAVALFVAVLFYWFSFRTYHDWKRFERERLILMPPNMDDDVLLHELLHVHLGDIIPMSTLSRVVAMSPLGPIIFWPKAYRLDYGKAGVTKEMKARGVRNPGLRDLPISLGIVPSIAFALPIFVFLTLLLQG